MNDLNCYLRPILLALDRFLENAPLTNEFQVIRHLQQLKIEPFDQFSLQHSKELFNAHFLCMHALYHLKRQYSQARTYKLLIHSVRIERHAYQQAQGRVNHNEATLADPLETYYLDARHYFETQEGEINQMLKSFWNNYLAQDQKHSALNTLDLPADADAQMIKTQYRRLVQRYHPDKGGCAKRFQAIQEAKETLEKSLF